MSEVATVGELKSADATFVTSFNYLLCDFSILMIKHGYYTGGSHLGEHGYFVKLCHFIID
jgi:hypothetical protein